MSARVTIEGRSPGLRGLPPEAVVVLPTFRRPDHLLKTLASLKAQRTGRRFAVIVVENDAERREGLAAARMELESGALRGLLVLAHERGNCHAYNAGWSVGLETFAETPFMAAIDDDECADPDWLENLLSTAQRLRADIVGGPQFPVFEAPETARLARHPVFTPHYDETGEVPILYSSGNVVFRREVLEVLGNPYLDPAFNFTGGGDSDLYRRARERGFRFAWCQEAPVFETTPARRTERSWLRDRGLRNGALSSMLEHRADSSLGGRTRTVAKSLALLAAAPARSLRLGFRTGSAVIGLYHCHVAVGRLLGEFGQVNEQYRRPEQN